MEEPPSKRHKVSAAHNGTPLPPGWSEHTAPTGHKYYYNKTTKKSTYTRPAFEQAPTPTATASPEINGYGSSPAQPASYLVQLVDDAPRQSLAQTRSAGSSMYQNGSQQHDSSFVPSHDRKPPPARRQPEDHPKRKAAIPKCEPWILVYTRLGRRFIHNTESKESFWKFPADVMKAVIAFDQMQLEEKYGSKKTAEGKPDSSVTQGSLQPVAEPTEEEKKALEEYEARRAASLAREKQEDAALLASNQEERIWVPPAQAQQPAYDSSEYEEIEATDTEGEGSDANDEDQAQQDENTALEFNEDDIAYQLAAMGEAYGLDPAEYGEVGEEDEEEGAEGLPLTDEERHQIFAEMLVDHGVSPYTLWDKLISDEMPHAILDDDRFTIIPSSRGRKEAFDRWAKERAATLKAERTARIQKGDDGRVQFLRFLAEKEKEVRKLYWVEFRRKHKKESALKGLAKFGDRDMEKAYREFAGKTKLGPQAQEMEFQTLLGETGDHREGRLDEDKLVAKVREDVRYWAWNSARKDEIVEDWLETQKDRGLMLYEHSPEKRRQERALQERTKEVEEARRMAEKDRRYARGELRDSEREVQRAMKVGSRPFEVD